MNQKGNYIELIPEFGADPLSPLAKTQEAILASSHAREVLEYQLLRYAKGEIGGGSALISGHRGAGKTTLIHDVIQHLNRSDWPNRKVNTPLNLRYFFDHSPISYLR